MRENKAKRRMTYKGMSGFHLIDDSNHVFAFVLHLTSCPCIWLKTLVQCIVTNQTEKTCCFLGCFLGIIKCKSCRNLASSVFPSLVPFVSFPALGTGCGISALGSGFTFSRAWHRLDVFPRLAAGEDFPALGTRCPYIAECIVVCIAAFIVNGQMWFI